MVMLRSADLYSLVVAFLFLRDLPFPDYRFEIIHHVLQRLGVEESMTENSSLQLERITSLSIGWLRTSSAINSTQHPRTIVLSYSLLKPYFPLFVLVGSASLKAVVEFHRPSFAATEGISQFETAL